MIDRRDAFRRATAVCCSTVKPRARCTWLLAAALLAAAAGDAFAATLTVNTTADESNIDGDCSLREAVATANGDAQVDGCVPAGLLGNDTIAIPAGTYSL